MSELASPRTGWVLPALLAVTTTAALGLSFLYLTRSNTGELGNIRVQVTDDDGKTGNSIRVYVAEAPLVQKEIVVPTSYSGSVQYPAPYRIKPNLKLTANKRPYKVLAETEFGFTWVADMLLEDLRESPAKDANPLLDIVAESWAIARVRGTLKSTLVFEEFTWEAKGLRMPASAVPPRTFEQSGTFATIHGQESVIFFPVQFESPPNIEISGAFKGFIVVTDCTAKSFKWKNVAKDRFGSEGEARWAAKGVLGETDKK